MRSLIFNYFTSLKIIEVSVKISQNRWLIYTFKTFYLYSSYTMSYATNCLTKIRENNMSMSLWNIIILNTFTKWKLKYKTIE